jgi:pseudouridine-5'-phosphate glycosidase
VSRGLVGRLSIAPEVTEALRAGRPVVALESTLISHGLPHPQNLEVARQAEAAVREAGAVPATIAIHRGRLLVGLGDAELEALATEPSGNVEKVARPSLAAALAGDSWGATTVSATMIAANAAGIRVFATGGIGGVHRGAFGGAAPAAHLDVSADLEELARTPVVVVCAGPKSILDVPGTLEYLETHGVPVVAVGQTDVPGFYARSAGMRAPISVADVRAAATVVRMQLDLGLGGILVCVPVPQGDALPEDVARTAVDRAIDEAATREIRGPSLSPWLIGRVGEITDGASIRANTALIVNNARIAGQLAAALRADRRSAPSHLFTVDRCR